MSVPELPKEQLVDLLVQLKILAHSQPDTARTIMASQPQLPHMLLRQLFELELVDSELLLKTLQGFAQAQAQAQQHQPAAVTQAPALVQSFAPPAPTYIVPAPAPAAGYATPLPMGYPAAPGYPPVPMHSGYQAYPAPVSAPAPAPAAAPAISPAALAAMTDEQRQAILRVVQMTPEELATIPLNERGVYIELRRQFGIV